MIAENIEEVNIILKIPKGAMKLRIQALMLDKDDKPYALEQTLNTAEIFDARKDFLENVECGDEYDTVYTLSDKVKKMLGVEQRQQMNKRHCPYCNRPLAADSPYVSCVICRSRRQNKFKLKKLDSEKPKCITFMEVKK